MAEYQLPPLKNAEKFEHLICDLLNSMDSKAIYQRSIDYQTFGVKGQKQYGVDIISQTALTVVQCKLKNRRANDDTMRKNLVTDFNNDLASVEGLTIPFNRLIFASTFRDDNYLQEFLTVIKHERNYPFNVYYWGWDTITKYIEQHDDIIRKYFRQFGNKKQPKTLLPDGALGNDLLRKNYVNYLIERYGDWKQFELNKKEEKFNWARFKKNIATTFKSSGINHIPLTRFEELVEYLQTRIDKTIFGRTQKSKGSRNYSSFEEHLKEIDQSPSI